MSNSYLSLAAETETVQVVAADGALDLAWLLVAIPALSAAVLLLGGRRTDRWGHLLGTAAPVASFLLGLVLFQDLLARDEAERSVGQTVWTWFEVGGLRADFGSCSTRCRSCSSC
jgi:NADH-quinone oxidoreductase subunit L